MCDDNTWTNATTTIATKSIACNKNNCHILTHPSAYQCVVMRNFNMTASYVPHISQSDKFVYKQQLPWIGGNCEFSYTCCSFSCSFVYSVVVVGWLIFFIALYGFVLIFPNNLSLYCYCQLYIKLKPNKCMIARVHYYHWCWPQMMRLPLILDDITW